MDNMLVDDISILTRVCQALEINLMPHTTLVGAEDLAGWLVPSFPPSAPVLILGIKTDSVADAVRQVLLVNYPATHPVQLVQMYNPLETRIEQIKLVELSLDLQELSSAALYIPALGATYSYEAFQQIIARLRAPDGCPWDQKQTHQSMRSDLLEETYEVLAALDANDPIALQEELGDLLLHIIMHAQIASESGEFSPPSILHGIHTKIVRRHPHVFSDLHLDDEQDVLAQWEQLKAQERLDHGKSESGILDSLNLALPALVQAQQFQSRAARVKFDWPDLSGVEAKVFEELQELQQAESQEQKHAELGDLLFAVVNLARWHQVDAESALRQANQRFRQRFKFIEQAAQQQGRLFSELTIEEMDQLWEAAKRSFQQPSAS